MTNETTKPVVTQAGKITSDEMFEMFGGSIPPEAFQLITNAPDDYTIGQVREELHHLAARHRLASQAVVSQDLVPVANKDSALPSDILGGSWNPTHWMALPAPPVGRDE